MWTVIGQAIFAKVNVASAYFVPSSCLLITWGQVKTENEEIATANEKEGKYQAASIENLVKNDKTSSGARKRES